MKRIRAVFFRESSAVGVYIHSSARFCELGEEGVYKVIHYSEAVKIPEQGFSAESSAEGLF